MYWYVLARWSGPLERIMVGIGAWFRRPQPWSQGAGRGRMARVLKKVRRLAKPLQAAASVVGAIVVEMLSAWRIHCRDSGVMEPAFSRTTWIARSGRWLRRMCQMAKTETIEEEAVLTTPALPRVGPPYVSPWQGEPATIRRSACAGMLLTSVSMAGCAGSSSCQTSSQRGVYEAVVGSAACTPAQCWLTAVVSGGCDSTNQEGPIRSLRPS